MAQSLGSSETTTAKPARQGRKPKVDKVENPGLGHNAEPLTEEEYEALQLHHELKVRAQQKKADAAKAAYELERNAANDMVKVACGELKVPAVEFRSFMADKNLSETEYRQKATTRALLRKRGGMPDVNGQYSLELPTKTDTADEAVLAQDDGWRAGKRADDPVPPKHIAAVMHQAWMKGWHEGQVDNAKKLKMADDVLARRAAPPAAPEPEKDPEQDVADQARRLKKSGFMERRAEAESSAAA